MNQKSRKNRSRKSNNGLDFESLESRQLMAGLDDIIAIPSTNFSPRTYDGTRNNLQNPEWGSTDEQLLRRTAAEYGDGISTLGGSTRPSAREISNLVSIQTNNEGGNTSNVSAYAYVWGQFLDHDLGLTSAGVTESAPISVPTGDPAFDPNGTGTQTIPFRRSIFDSATGTSATNPRQQLNELTAFIDGSMIYGVDKVTSDSLRTFVGGKLKIGSDGLPPVDSNGFFLAGDERANENVELTSMHALFIREHNFWASRISACNPGRSDESIFQQARAIVIGEIQAITYNEFVPALLGDNAMSRYTGYKPNVNPGINNEFSTAAYRLHTLINDDVEFFGNDGRAVRDEVALREAFFNPDLLRETGIDSILKYVASTQSQEFDTQIVDSLRDFLLTNPGEGGFDLASLNIQRGRDHGLADYDATRVAYGLPRVTSFAEITSDENLQTALSTLYSDVNDVDLWVGLLAEDKAAGSMVGKTAQRILADQYQRTRDGDRFWYQRIFYGNSLRQIESTTLADIISRNTSISNLQRNVFEFRSQVGGQVFTDTNSNGRLDRRESGLRGIQLELLDDEGSIMATTTTNGQGRYRFDDFKETGDYTVRVASNQNLTFTTANPREFLVSRGDLNINLNFGVGSSNSSGGSGQRSQMNLAAIDLAFSETDTLQNLIAKKRKVSSQPRS